MKNRFVLLWAMLFSLLLAGCGKPEAPRTASSPANAPHESETAPMPEESGPADLPPCPGFVLLESSEGDLQSGSSVLISSQTVPFLLNFYTTDLAADGWVLESSLPQGQEHHLQFRKGERFLGIRIGPGVDLVGLARLHLAWGQATGTEEVREAFEPEPEESPAAVDGEVPQW